MDADRKPRPGLLDFKRVVAPLRIEVAEDWSGFRLRSGHDFADTSAFEFRYVVEADGETYDAGSVPVVPVAAQPVATVPLPAALAGSGAASGPAVLTVSAVLAAESAWAAAGHEIAWGQAVQEFSRVMRTVLTESLAVLDDGLCLGPAIFSRVTAMPTSIRTLPVQRFGLVHWWAPTDNDLGREWGSEDDRPLATQWNDAGLHRLHTRLVGISAESTPDGGERLIVRTRLGAADKQFGVVVDYTWTSDGRPSRCGRGSAPTEPGQRRLGRGVGADRIGSCARRRDRTGELVREVAAPELPGQRAGSADGMVFASA